MKKILGVLLIFSLAIVLAGCKKKSDRPSFKDADFRIANAAIAEDLDLHTTSMATDFTILGNIMEGLFRLDGNDAVVDGIAKVADTVVSEDGLTYTFKLRSGAKWSNGDEVTANDFVYSWQRAVQKHENITIAYASMFFIIENAEEIYNGTETDLSKLGVKAVDKYTLQVKLDKPVPYFMQLMAFPSFFPAHKATIEKYGQDYGKSAKALIFNGPFKVKYWNTDYGIYLVKNETYWDAENVKIKSVSHKLVDDPNTLIALYDAGEIDRVGVTGAQFKDRQDEATIRVEPVTWYLVFNTEDEQFSNENLRKFFMYALDKKELTEVMKPYVPVDAYVPRGYASLLKEDGSSVDYRDFKNENVDATKVLDVENFNDFSGSKNGIYNATAAQNYLNEALTELEKPNITVNFTCFNTEGWKPLFENIQSQINEYEGITFQLNLQPSTAVYDSYDANNYEMGFYGWGPDYPDPMTFLELYHSADSHNILKNPNAEPLGILNAEYDALIEAARDNFEVLADTELRYEKLVQAETILLENAYVVPLANRAGGILMNDKVEGYADHNFGPDATYKWIEIKK